MGGSDWDTYDEAPRGRRTPLWGRALVGCGAAALLLLGGCAGLAYWAAHSGRDTVKGFIAEKVDRVMEKPWAMLAGVADAIQTDEGALALYRDSPLLKGDYPTEEDFLVSAAVWRAKVADFPRTPPSLDELDQNDFRLTISRKTGRGAKSLEMAYTAPGGARVRLAWEDGKLAEIDVR